MNDTVTKFWSEARIQLLAWRASAGSGTVPEASQLRARLEEAAHRADPNRPTSIYNLPSPDSAAIDQIIAGAMWAAKKWLADGRPFAPPV